jgi:hypothetical protein
MSLYYVYILLPLFYFSAPLGAVEGERERVEQKIATIEKEKAALEKAREDALKAPEVEQEKERAYEAFDKQVKETLLLLQEEQADLATIKDSTLRSQLGRVLTEVSREAIKDQALLQKIQEDISQSTNPSNQSTTVVESTQKKLFDEINHQKELLADYLSIGLNGTDETRQAIADLTTKIITSLEKYEKYAKTPDEHKNIAIQLTGYKKILEATQGTATEFATAMTGIAEKITQERLADIARNSAQTQYSNFAKIKNWILDKQATILAKLGNYQKAADIRNRLYQRYQEFNIDKAITEQPQLEMLLRRVYQENLNYLNKYDAQWRMAKAADKQAASQIYIDTLVKTINDLFTLQWTIKEKYMINDAAIKQWNNLYENIEEDIGLLNSTLANVILGDTLSAQSYALEQSKKKDVLKAVLSDTNIKLLRSLPAWIETWKSYTSTKELLADPQTWQALNTLINIYQHISLPTRLTASEAAGYSTNLKSIADTFAQLATQLEESDAFLLPAQEWNTVEKTLQAQGAGPDFIWLVRDFFFEPIIDKAKYPKTFITVFENLSAHFNSLQSKLNERIK